MWTIRRVRKNRHVEYCDIGFLVLGLKYTGAAIGILFFLWVLIIMVFSL